MAINEALDYFDLVSKITDSTKASAEAIEKSLSASLTNPPVKSKHDTCISILLERFVLTDKDRLSSRALSLALTLLKQLGRQIAPTDKKLASKQAISELLKLVLINIDHIADNYAVDSCNEALTCVSNTLLLVPSAKQYVEIECQGAQTLHAVLQSPLVEVNPTTALLCGRCLFLLTASPESAICYVSQFKCPDLLAKLVVLYTNSKIPGRFSAEQVVAELMKAAMSLCVYFQQGVSDNDENIMPVDHTEPLANLLQASLDVLISSPLIEGHLANSARQAVGLAMNFSTKQPEPIHNIWFPSDGSSPKSKWKYVDGIFDQFSEMVNSALETPTNSFESDLVPTTLLLTRLVSENQEALDRLFTQIFPGTIDYSTLPEDRDGMSSKLVRLMRTPQGGMLPNTMGDLVLALLGQNIKQFILVVGYGNAAGYMMARNIAIPHEIIEEVAAGADSGVNPVTGRYFSQEAADEELRNMTQEEKEREAERLFVLFERLNKTGVIKVENPMRAAMESGRFQEISSSEDEDKDM